MKTEQEEVAEQLIAQALESQLVKDAQEKTALESEIKQAAATAAEGVAGAPTAQAAAVAREAVALVEGGTTAQSTRNSSATLVASTAAALSAPNNKASNEAQPLRTGHGGGTTDVGDPASAPQGSLHARPSATEADGAADDDPEYGDSR